MPRYIHPPVPLAFAWSARPPAAAHLGCPASVTIPGGRVVAMVSDGVRWRPIGPFVVLQPMAGVTANVDEVPVQQVLVPGGLLGEVGGLRLYALFSFTGSGGARTLRAKFGGATFCFQAAGTANFSVSLSRVLSNVTPTSQIALPNAVYEGVLSGNPIFSSSIDTTQDQILSLSVQLASAGDSATLRKLIVEVL